jgi:hypothetical protein
MFISNCIPANPFWKLKNRGSDITNSIKLMTRAAIFRSLSESFLTIERTTNSSAPIKGKNIIRERFPVRIESKTIAKPPKNYQILGQEYTKKLICK